MFDHSSCNLAWMDFKVHGTNIDQQIIESRWLTFPNGHTLSDEALNSFVRHIPTDTSPIHKYSKISAVAMYVMQPALNPIFSYKVHKLSDRGKSLQLL